MNDQVARIVNTIDADRFADIAERYAEGDFSKYLDLPGWIERNLRRIQRVGLDTGVRRRVLDIGCGTGYFLYICKLLGHEVLGIDLPNLPMFKEITELLGVPVVNVRVRAFRPLPSLGAHFDVVTAHMVCFNGHRTEHVWGPAEWQFFLDDLGADSMYLEINREIDGTLFTPGLEQFFVERGAQIAGHRILIETRAGLVRRSPVEAAR